MSTRPYVCYDLPFSQLWQIRCITWRILWLIGVVVLVTLSCGSEDISDYGVDGNNGCSSRSKLDWKYSSQCICTDDGCNSKYHDNFNNSDFSHITQSSETTTHPNFSNAHHQTTTGKSIFTTYDWLSKWNWNSDTYDSSSGMLRLTFKITRRLLYLCYSLLYVSNELKCLLHAWISITITQSHFELSDFWTRRETGVHKSFFYRTFNYSIFETIKGGSLKCITPLRADFFESW